MNVRELKSLLARLDDDTEVVYRITRAIPEAPPQKALLLNVDFVLLNDGDVGKHESGFRVMAGGKSATSERIVWLGGDDT